MIILRLHYKCCHRPTWRISRRATNHSLYETRHTYYVAQGAGDTPRIFVAMVTFGRDAVSLAPCAPDNGLTTIIINKGGRLTKYAQRGCTFVPCICNRTNFLYSKAADSNAVSESSNLLLVLLSTVTMFKAVTRVHRLQPCVHVHIKLSSYFETDEIIGGWCSDNVLDMYLGGSRLECGLGYRPFPAINLLLILQFDLH